MRFLEHEIDPSTIRVTVDAPFLERLEDLVQMAVFNAAIYDKVTTIYADKDQQRYQIAYRDYDRADFIKMPVQCPKEADELWQAQHGEPRPFPSMVVTTGHTVIVAKPSLCDGCVFRLEKSVTGHCHNRHFKALEIS